MAKIDTTKPLQLADGRPALFAGIFRGSIGNGDIIVEVTEGGMTCGRHFNPTTGKHFFGSLPDLQNVPEAPTAPKPIRTVNKLTPLARTVLDYLQSKGDASPLEATLDLGVNSGSFTRRITELRRAGYPITDENRKHPITGRQYKRYFYRLDS
jgi:hypothetical protein